MTLDISRFDALTRAIGRRGLLAVLLALISGAARPRRVARAGKSAPCDKRGRGQRCRKNAHCCSRTCKKKKGKRKGKCRCSELRERCAEDGDCCDFTPDVFDSAECGPDKQIVVFDVCCKGVDRRCEDNADCCGSLVCNANGACEAKP